MQSGAPCFDVYLCPSLMTGIARLHSLNSWSPIFHLNLSFYFFILLFLLFLVDGTIRIRIYMTESSLSLYKLFFSSVTLVPFFNNFFIVTLPSFNFLPLHRSFPSPHTLSHFIHFSRVSIISQQRYSCTESPIFTDTIVNECRNLVWSPSSFHVKLWS